MKTRASHHLLREGWCSFLGRHFSFCLQHGAIEMEPNPLACLFRPFSTDLPPPLLSGMHVTSVTQSCVPCLDVLCIDCITDSPELTYVASGSPARMRGDEVWPAKEIRQSLARCSDLCE